MRKFIPLVLAGLLAFGCKGGDGGSTSVESTGGTTGSSSAPATGGEYTLKFSPKQGDKTTYVMTTDAGPQMNMTMEMTMACDKVEGENATMVSTFDNIKMTANGKEMPTALLDPMKKMKITTVMDSHGKTISTSIEGAPAGTKAPDANSTVFPDKPVKIGDSWDGQTKVQGADIKAHYKLTKVENNIATIEITMEGLPNGASPDGPTVTNIDLGTGMLDSMTSKIKMTANGQAMSVTTEMKKK